uniref:Uncharacterized protein n=1 Tax=Romanomermis culicivorax TaxID=13658 RepID=A0A915IHU6_ROMCU
MKKRKKDENLVEVTLERWQRLHGETCNGKEIDRKSAARPAIYYILLIYCILWSLTPKYNVPRLNSY